MQRAHEREGVTMADTVGRARDAAALIASAYDAFASVDDPSYLTPTVELPTGYAFVAWVTMDDFVFVPGVAAERRFYGFLARSTSGDRSVLALRGTVGALEWWDDLHVLTVPWMADATDGRVAQGFANIYDTLDLLVPTPGGPAPAHAVDANVRPGDRFARKVGAIMRYDATQRVPNGDVSPQTIVCGHSLGAALATLFVADNAVTERLAIQTLWTFASPRVGDRSFAAAFARQTTIAQAYRVFNRPDVVPNFPLALEGYAHVGTPFALDSRASDGVAWTPPCFHALASHAVCLGASAPSAWSCAVGDLSAPLVFFRRLVRSALGIGIRDTVLGEPPAARLAR